MKLREFNTNGILKFQDVIVRAREGADISRKEILDILSDDTISRVVSDRIDLTETSFRTRFDAGKYFYQLFQEGNVSYTSRGMWAWVSLFFFDEICPKIGAGRKVVKTMACYIPDFGNYQRYYRHLLYTPFNIYREHHDAPSRAMSVLCTPVHTPGEVVEEIASRQFLVTSPAIIGATTKLYVGADGKHKRGAGRKVRNGARRLAMLMNQFDLTYSLYSMDIDRFVALLPPEFDEFRG